MADNPKNAPLMGEYSYTKRPDIAFQTDKYSYKEYSYPSDLFGNGYSYGGNYVIFYINVLEDSYLAKDKPENFVDLAAGERYSTEITRMGLDAVSGSVGSAISTGIAAAVAGGMFTLNLKAAAAAGIFGAVGGGIAGGVVSAAAAGKMARQTKRLKTAIALHVPNDLSIRYSANWSDEEMMLMMAGGAISEASTKAYDEGGINPIASGIAAAALSTPTAGNYLSVASGLAANPKKEQVFKGVNFREFQMNYSFFPRNATESNNILNIIKMFKLHMHPEFKDSAAFIYLYPSEFDIFYYHFNKENKSIHRHTSCVLADMTVNYSPNGVFNTFADGTPTNINMTLSFKELAVLTKQQIEDGY